MIDRYNVGKMKKKMENGRMWMDGRKDVLQAKGN